MSGWAEAGPERIVPAMALLAGAFALWLRLARSRGWGPWLALAPAFAVAGGALLRVALTSGIDADESEHLHVSYLVGQGTFPYRDFRQTHTPLLWILTAPVLGLLPETPYVLFGFRTAALLAGLVSILCVAVALRPLASREPAWLACFALLALSLSVVGETFRFRPDPFMVAASLGSLACQSLPSPDRRSPRPGSSRRASNDSPEKQAKVAG